jgi:hypothetical protein
MAIVYLHSRGVIHGHVHPVSLLDPTMDLSLIGAHKGDVLVDDGDVAVLCDAQLYTITVSSNDEFCQIPSKCRWMPWERLIADNSCALGLPSKPADIYGAAITIIQVR